MRFGLFACRFDLAAQPRCGDSVVPYVDAAIARFKVRRQRHFKVAGISFVEAWDRFSGGGLWCDT